MTVCFAKPSCVSASTLTLSLIFVLVLSPFVTAADRPNIITIMGDDMGYSDIGCYGGEIDTPNLNRLAAGGVRFSSFYNMARCCPTRASLLTGLYPHQAGIGWMMNDSGHDGYRGELNRRCVTMAEVLGAAGYRTYMSGKWHVTSKVKPQDTDEKVNWPLQRGFDLFYGTIHGAGSFWDPFSLTRNNEYISPVADDEYQPDDGFYYTDAISDHAVRFIAEHDKSGDQPFFMYVSYTAAHWPMHARERDIAKYKGRYDAGYEAIRRERLERLLTTGLVPKDSVEFWPMQDAWKETEYWDWDKRNMEVYAAMVDSMDQGIGRIIAALEKSGDLDNTIILYLQDNGGCAEAYGRRGEGKPREDKPTLEPLAKDYLQPDMQPKQTRDGYPVRTGKGVMAGPSDTYIGYGKGWATVSNTPFREYKHWVHEGGISTPLIMHWPEGISAGGIAHMPSHLIDIMATVVDAAQAEYPTEFHNGQQIKPMEGISLLPAARGEQGERQQPIFWEHEGNRAVRDGDMKLVAKGADSQWELYDLRSDRSEQHDLAAEQPETVTKMSKMWQAFAERANVLPLTPYYNKKKGKAAQAKPKPAAAEKKQANKPPQRAKKAAPKDDPEAAKEAAK
jgi:arylsulfatase